jgi:hypothetical protein
MWIVMLTTGKDLRICFGPFDDEALASRFAEFVTAEVDPAVVLRVESPVTELLNWREAVGRG